MPVADAFVVTHRQHRSVSSRTGFSAPEVPVEGTVDADEVRRSVNAQSEQLQTCFKTSVEHGGQTKARSTCTDRS